MTVPAWATWAAEGTPADYTLGVEEEIMMLEPGAWSLAHEIDRVLPALEPELGAHVTAETHKSALELRSRPHKNVAGVAAELEDLRGALEAQLATLGLRAAASGTHPFAVWQEVRVSTGPRYQRVYDSMRELARREPTFALHVHVGVADPDAAIDLLNRMRGHLPLLLALSANSPLWQGRDTGLASARTPLFQAFPRVGIPRVFRDYEDWAETVDLLLRCEAFEEPTFLWWDVRPQPRFGTVEVRILDAQSTLAETVGLTALVQCIARLELEDGYLQPDVLSRPELLEENRFIATRDGMDARMLDPVREALVPARLQLDMLLEACAPHAHALGCVDELLSVRALAEGTGAARQLELSRGDDGLPGVVAALADLFTSDAVAGPEGEPVPDVGLEAAAAEC
jgi:glutamate---cysteine ligase / carboxylate-amine ligase